MNRWLGSMCRAFDCDDYANPYIDALPLCGYHGRQVANVFLDDLIEAAEIKAERRTEHRREVREATAGNREPSVVYYARIGNYIKIGHTTRLRNRLTTLRIDELLAIELGGYDLEQERHREFAPDRIDLRRENFRPSQALYTHIAGLRAEYDLPHWTKLPRTSQITTRRKESA